MTQQTERRPVKYIFVTGGVVSSLGKGLAAASIGRLLEDHGYKVALQKFDPYINVDPGTMTREPVTIAADLLAVAALQVMETRRITSVPVIDADRRPLGVLHIHDLWQTELF